MKIQSLKEIYFFLRLLFPRASLGPRQAVNKQTCWWWLRLKVSAAMKSTVIVTQVWVLSAAEVTAAILGATTAAQLSTAMGIRAPGDTRLKNPTGFRDEDTILQLPASRCHPCTQTHCCCLGLHGHRTTLLTAGTENCHTLARGHTATLGQPCLGHL